ncbi:O-acetyl-ADP-ribose deacetylase (regulator of RNase III) [Hymenobacter luteus]|uniref:O-acetyl-ADP-ribose deacetylase (Regulator of RNase III) n=2 Tax=Hymenobacter TaxID=89966 RepID=A0A7W9T512_9BACT|nr:MULTISPECIES: O-acetyl-ADP-ribose deacetylase [Hymenobacter]MBB4602608.1 O-acetyl-ADP-ribose deacetylase (regulator of RNase III) [Hymenobacter latericoloratus]MBB6060499.1 O-acetyl-ADP-ribose deacetylase (regulator of RNase III) [Hymenobacter luteus]
MLTSPTPHWRANALSFGRILLYRGDITRLDTDAIVNAANSSLLGGGGVDGAIHRAGGPEILAACRQLRASHYGSGLRTGEAVITTGGRLPARHVIHTVGPVWNGGHKHEPELLANCYRNSLGLAAKHGVGSVAFPGISTGIYGYPKEQAAPIAIQEVRRFLQAHAQLREVVFVAFGEDDFALYERELIKLQADYKGDTAG